MLYYRQVGQFFLILNLCNLEFSLMSTYFDLEEYIILSYQDSLVVGTTFFFPHMLIIYIFKLFV